MKYLFTLILVVMLAVGSAAVAQQTPPGYAAGKIIAVTALDTLFSTFEKSDSVATASWFGPQLVYVAKSNGDFKTSKSLPVAYQVFAEEAFTMRAFDVAGDAFYPVATSVDSTFGAVFRSPTTNAPVAGMTSQYSCEYLLPFPISSLRLNPASGDTIYVKSLTLLPE